MVKKCRAKFDHCQFASYYYWRFFCVLSECASCSDKDIEIRNSETTYGLLELEFRLTVYFWHGLNRVCRALRSFSSISPLSEIWAANLVRSRSVPVPRRPRSSFRSRSIFFSHARSPLRSRSLNFRPAPLRFALRSRSAHMLWSRQTFIIIVAAKKMDC